MAEDMIERAAKAMCISQLYGTAWHDLNEGSQDTYRKNARAALLAALDPEDEALVVELQVAIEQVTIHGVRDDRPYAEARAALVALKRLAQGAIGSP